MRGNRKNTQKSSRCAPVKPPSSALEPQTEQMKEKEEEFSLVAIAGPQRQLLLLTSSRTGRPSSVLKSPLISSLERAEKPAGGGGKERLPEGHARGPVWPALSGSRGEQAGAHPPSSFHGCPSLQCPPSPS